MQNKSHPNNFKVPGTKLKSRFHYSHRAMRHIQREEAKFYAGAPKEYGYQQKHYNALNKRQSKKCKHEKMVSEGYANGESGADHFRCAKCGWSFHHQYY